MSDAHRARNAGSCGAPHGARALADEAFDRGLIVRQHRETFAAGPSGRQDAAAAAGARRWRARPPRGISPDARSPSATIGRLGPLGERAARGARCRWPCADRADSRPRARSRRSRRRRSPRRPRRRRNRGGCARERLGARSRSAPDCARLAIRRAHRGGVAAMQPRTAAARNCDDTWMSIDGRGGRRTPRAPRTRRSSSVAGEDVVGVGGDRSAARSAAPCAWRPSRRGRRRNCRSARRRRPGGAARRAPPRR